MLTMKNINTISYRYFKIIISTLLKSRTQENSVLTVKKNPLAKRLGYKGQNFPFHADKLYFPTLKKTALNIFFSHTIFCKLKQPPLILFLTLIFATVSLAGNSLALAAEELGEPTGKTSLWDFTGELPADGTLNEGAVLNGGLIPTTFDPLIGGGFRLKEMKFSLPEAFRFESQIVPGGELPDGDAAAKASGIVWDSMYVTYKKEPAEQFNRGFQLALESVGGNRCRPRLYLGYGDRTDALIGPIAECAPGQPVRLSFYYNANGSVFWDFAEKKAESETSGVGSLAESRYTPVIGDRIGSNFDPFPGKIERVAITPCRREPFGIVISGRKAFRRGEKASVSVRLLRVSSAPFQNAKLTAVLRDGNNILQTAELDAGALLAENGLLSIPLDTRLVPGQYPLEVSVRASQSDNTEITVSRCFEIGIGPMAAERFKTLMWNFNARPFEELNAFGFTHGIDSFLPRGLAPDRSEEQSAIERFDRALLNGLQLVSHVAAIPPNEPADEFYRFDRDGKILLSNKKPMLEVSNPAVIEYARKTAEANAALFAGHPGFAGILANTERRDGVLPSFGFEPEQYRTETGREIPAEAAGAMPPRNLGRERFPDGVIPDNDALLHFYSWFWNGGDGWPRINTAIADEYRKAAPSSFFSFFDPAVRVPPKWGSGGNVDVLSQWVYAVPEPLSVAGPVEELFAMAAGRNQRVMIMTQIICYRNQIAPKEKNISPLPSWAVEKPDADFPTIPPDSLQEATWAMIAKPVEGIMYHGYSCIVETGAQKGYTFTNAETPKRLTHLLNNVVSPLGPVLKKLPREDSPVIVLESFANALFSGYATWGWKAPDLLFLQRARLDPRVIYDETILRDGFGSAKVLYMPQCEFLTESVLKKIIEFQQNGGIIIGDEKLIKAIQPDINLSVIDQEDAQNRNRLDNTAETAAEKNDVLALKTKMNKSAGQLREKLAPLYTPNADSSSPELITFSRKWRDVDYLFVLNDRRTYGDYVGQWKMTMEQGLPFDGFATMADAERKIGAVYELSRGGKIPFTRAESGAVKINLSFETNDGRFFAFLEKPIVSVALDVPETVTRGDSVPITFRVLDASGKPIHALLPVDIRVFNSSGRELDGAGYAAAEEGICSLEILTNINDPDGDYRVMASDRASGKRIEKRFSVK